jgi:tetratricopeptide (TPR) repeat protein
MPTFIAAKCPNCGGDLQVPSDRASVKCMYCTGDVILHQAVQPVLGGNVKNWMKLANAALEAGNQEEAIANANKVLEVDPTNHDAWFVKGVASGWLSNLLNCRLDEMVANMLQAIEYVPEAEAQDVKEMCALMINDAASAYYDMAATHMMEFVTVDSAWPDFLNQADAAFTAYDAAHDINPQNKVVLQNIIRVLTDLIQGVRYDDTNNRGEFVRRVHSVKADYSAKLTTLKIDYEAQLKALDPSFQAKEVKVAKVGMGQHILTVLRLLNRAANAAKR